MPRATNENLWTWKTAEERGKAEEEAWKIKYGGARVDWLGQLWS